MVRKITSGGYLKRYDNMTAAERQEYLNRVGEWLSAYNQVLAKKGDALEARLQNVLQASVGWNDAECMAFEEGAVLLSALVGVADTKLPELLYAISAKRSIRNMIQLLSLSHEPYPMGEWGNSLQSSQNVRMQAGTAKETLMQDIKQPVKRGPGRPRKSQTALDGKTAEHKEGKLVFNDITPARPKHFDQYAHLLPKKTQERIAKYGPLMRELDEAREKLRLLMNDQTASAADREAWAKRVKAIDKEVGVIKREADVEWDKLAKSGRVVVDDLGVARLLPDPSPQNGKAQEKEPGELTSEDKHRRRSLRKWLIDTRNGNGDQREKHVKKWCDNFREYLTLEGDKAFEDEKIKRAIEHYQIDVASLQLNIER